MLSPIPVIPGDRKSTRLNSSHTVISYAVFCLKKKNTHQPAELPGQRSHVCANRTCAVHSARCVPLLCEAACEHPVDHTMPVFCFFFFNDTATPEIYPLSLHAALPI